MSEPQTPEAEPGTLPRMLRPVLDPPVPAADPATRRRSRLLAAFLLILIVVFGAVDVTGLLTRGENQIRIEVANLAVNFMAGRPPPDYKALNAQYGERFQPQDMDQIKPVTSGLLGPVRLVAAREEARSKK